MKLDRRRSIVPAHPPEWLVAGVESRGHWPQLRELSAFTGVPILREDGTVLQSAGYDEETGVLYSPCAEFPAISDEVDLDDAEAACEMLRGVVVDFPFERDEDFAAWLAALLTPVARFAFEGPAPFFLIDANIRAAGKTLLAQVIGRITLGHELPVSSYTADHDELRKRITTIALAGDRVVQLDNIAGLFGNPSLDRALTSTRWSDRILGTNTGADVPLHTVWIGTGNNVIVAGDTMRRVVPIRLDVLDEHPEQRSGFRHPDLLAHVDQHWPRLLVAALTILRAYCRCGRPRTELAAFGSFEGWSNLVRQAVVWCGVPDPCLTRMRLQDTVEAAGSPVRQLFDALEACLPDGRFRAAELISQVYVQHLGGEADAAAAALRSAIDAFVGPRHGKTPNAGAFGRRLAVVRRQVVDGRYLDTDPNAPKRQGAVWVLRRVEGGGA